MLFVATAVIMCVGFAGIIVPWVPGLALMWAAALVYGLVGEFGATGAVAFGVITAMTLVGEALGFILPGRAAGRAGAPLSSIAVGGLGAVIGFFAIPAFGFLVGGILGIFIAEALRTSGTAEAWRTTVATLVGFGVGALVQCAFALAIVITWLIWVIVV